MSVSRAARTAWAPLAEVDPDVWAAVRGEADRQRRGIELIASENYAFAAVMEAQGSCLTNKYAEGLPGRRYYGGCQALMHVIAAKAVALGLAGTPEFRADQQRTVENAALLAAEIAARGGRIVSGGTETHLLMVDVRPFGVTGREAERLLEDVGITVNKNAIPFDPAPPAVASGIRLGTPAVTTRGFGPDEMRDIARLLVATLVSRHEPATLASIAVEVGTMAAGFPVPGLPGD